jgi:thioredoxin reductase/ferredoxin
VAYVVPAVLGGLALAVMALVSSYASRKRNKALAQPAQVHHSRVLIHSINDDRCTGCDACVAVCPTNVLDLVENKSRVLHFQDCIQCEACMWACPTTALVMHPEGTEPPLYKMPELDEFYQTAVPGQYLIGEVAGKPLVKNAANLGRGVVEHMLVGGLRPMNNPNVVDVAIVGSGPGGLSAALTCMTRGLSYILLDKENIIASTVARYPKGKLIMAEPYDVPNLSLLPAFDSSKEEMIPIWQELIERVGLKVQLNQTVETVAKRPDHLFDVHTNGGDYVAQRVVLSTGLRGKPRTLRVPGENQAKVRSLLEDPDDHRGRAVCVVGGGDSALEAAIALADAGAKVVLSYRGRSFARAQPKNKSQVEGYAAQRRIKIKYMSQVVEFAADTVTLQMADGTQKRYPNHAAFVLIGADPPVKWLNKLGIRYVERPHMFALSGSDAMVHRFLGEEARECPTTARGAAALLHGRPVSEVEAPHATEIHPEQTFSGPRKFLRAATSMFRGGQKLDKPMPLSEFAKQQRRHSGRGRRDQLDAGERTRILRMLRDDGARQADEESKVVFLEDLAAGGDGAPAGRSFHEESPPIEQLPEPMSYLETTTSGPPPAPGAASGMPKQAVIVGLARATAQGPRQTRSHTPAPNDGLPDLFRLPDDPRAQQRAQPRPTPDPDGPTRFEPMTFDPDDEATQFMGDQGIGQMAHAPPPAAPPRSESPPPPLSGFDDDDERTMLANFDPEELMRRALEADNLRAGAPPQAGPQPAAPTPAQRGATKTRSADLRQPTPRPAKPPPTPPAARRAPPPPPRLSAEDLFSDSDVDEGLGMFDSDSAATKAIQLDPKAAAAAAAANGRRRRPPPGPGPAPGPGDLTATRVDSLSDVDWDLE